MAGVASLQTLSEAERRIVAAWAADCAERVLGLFEAEAPDDARPRDGIARTRAFARGELDVAGEIRRRFVAGGAARGVSAPAAAAARAAGQATAVPHMGAHALGAAAYAAKAAGLGAANPRNAIHAEIRWQLGQVSVAVRAALRKLPPVGENSSGPLGPGLLASGLLGAIVREIQAGLADSNHSLAVEWPMDRQDLAASARSRKARFSTPRTPKGPMEPLERGLAARIARARGTSVARLGLRFDRVAQRVAIDLRAHAELVVPDGRMILATLTAPILHPAKTVQALRTKIAALAARSSRRDVAAQVEGNGVRLRMRSPAPHLGSKLVLFVHNPDVDARQLLDEACALDG